MLKILTGEIKLAEMDIERDFDGIDRLMQLEEWPFSKNDVELSHQQPKSTSYVARKGDKLVGFFTTHNFGDVGYLDMMIVDKEFRKTGVAKALYLKTMLGLKRKGLKKYVVHTTNDSFPLIRFLRFKPGDSFTLLVRAGTTDTGAFRHKVRRLDVRDYSDILRLDSEAFGLERRDWIAGLLQQDDVVFYGTPAVGGLDAVLCLRPRKDGAFCMEPIHGELSDLLRLTEQAVLTHGRRQLECFVRTDSLYHRALEEYGFKVPDFFKEIGPLVEWKKGDTGNLGAGKLSLSWL